MVLEKSPLVVKSNHLIEASYKLKLDEQRLILLAISNLRNRMPMSKQKVQRVTALEYAKMFNLQPKIAYQQLKKATIDLYNRDIKTYDETGSDRFRWVERVKHKKEDGYEGFVELHFTDSIAPYLTKIYNNFTSYELKSLSDIKSTYAIRLFEMLKRWEQKGERFITMKDFRKWFEIEKKYKKYNDLKKRVVEPAIKELEDKANLIISWDEIKKGRKVVGFDFMFEENKQMDLFK